MRNLQSPQERSDAGNLDKAGERYMSKPPGFVLYVRDLLMSPTVRRMTDKQFRAYIKLLCYSWLEEPIATLPNDPDELAIMAGVTPAVWGEIQALIISKFESDGNGRIYNDKLRSQARQLTQKSFAGKSGWTSKRRKKVAENGKNGGRPTKRKPAE